MSYTKEVRIDSKRLHPSVKKACDAAFWTGGGGDPKSVQTYQSEWGKRHGAGCAVYLALGLALFILVVLGAKSLELAKAARVFSAMGFGMFWTFLGTFLLYRQGKHRTVAEFESLIPALDVSPTQRAYADTLIALHRSGRSPEEIEESMTTLNALLDEEARLNALLEHLAGRDLEAETPALDAEAEDLSRRIESSRDPVAKEAYAQSLSLLQERIDALRSTDLGIERVQAHLSLLRQAVFTTRDAARRLATAPSATPELATESLRAAVARAREQTGETERALAELRAI